MSSACDEGFICPYCLVGFGSASKLQGHFVEMHSDIDLPEAKSYKASQVSDVCVCACVFL